MRAQGIVILSIAAFAATGASASSIVTLAPGVSTPSIIKLGVETAIDPSIVAATPAAEGPSPSIVALADVPAGDTPSIISLGGPPPPGEASAQSVGSQRMMMPVVIRGGDVGQTYASPAPAPTSNSGSSSGSTAGKASAQAGVPLLDPNDRGTPSKRKALKKQAARLAQEAAAKQQSGQADPSTQPAPLGQ